MDIGYVRLLLYMLVLDDQKFMFTLKLLRLGSKDWWKLVTGGYFPIKNTTVIWENFTNMLCVE